MIRAPQKPSFRPQVIKNQRLPKGKAVTIGVGFRCSNGVVLCSDTQITWKGRHKAYETKQFYLSGRQWTMASVYAGDPQLWKSFRDKFLELIQAHYRSTSREPETTKELRDILETALCYFTELETDPMALCLLMGFIIPNKEIRLVRSEGKLISDISGFDHIGCGDSSLLRYLIPIMADDQQEWPSSERALRIGTFLVLQAKRYVEDCGGDIEAFFLHWNGGMQTRSSMTYNWEQRWLSLELYSSRVFKALGNQDVSDEEFESRLNTFCNRLREERRLWK
jgi:hypothetical protein